MRKGEFTQAEIIAALKAREAGVPVAEVLRKHGISTTPASAGGPGMAGR